MTRTKALEIELWVAMAKSYLVITRDRGAAARVVEILHELEAQLKKEIYQ